MAITYDKIQLVEMPFSDLKSMLDYAEEQKQIWANRNIENKGKSTEEESKAELEQWHYWDLVEDAIRNIMSMRIKDFFRDYEA